MIDLYLIKIFDLKKYYQEIMLSDYRKRNLLLATDETYINTSYLTQSLLNYVMDNYYQIKLKADDIVLNDIQRPSFKNINYEFSISHSKKYLVLGVSKVAFGVDLESKKRKIKYSISVSDWTKNEAVAKLKGISILKQLKLNDLDSYFFNEINYANHILVSASISHQPYNITKIKKHKLIKAILNNKK